GATGLADPAGAYDVRPTMTPGAPGLSVADLQEGGPRRTGVGIPASRIPTRIPVNNTNGVVLDGGGLTVTGSLTLTAGVLRSSAAHLLTLANSVSVPPAGGGAGHVEGTLGMEF